MGAATGELEGTIAAGDNRSELRAGAPVLASATIGMALQSSAYVSLGTIIVPLTAAFDWSRTQIVSVTMFSAMASFVMAPLVGYLLGRIAPRRIAFTGFVLYSLAVAIAGLTGPNIITWWGAWLLISLATFLISPLVWTYAITHSFRSRRGLAIGIALSGTGIANAAIPLLMVSTIGFFGWRGAYFTLAALIAIIGLGVTWRFFHIPQSAQQPGGHAIAEEGMTSRQAMADGRYWRLCAVIFLVSAAMGALNIHFQSILIDRGFSLVGAAALATLFGPAQICGRLVGGYLLDRVPGPLLGGLIFLLPAAATLALMFAPGVEVLVILFPVCAGLATGLELDLATYMASRYFGSRHFGSIFAPIFCCFTIGYTVGPIAAALVRDVRGSYDLVLLAVAIAMPVAAIFVGTLGRYPDAGKDRDAPI